MFRVGSPEKQSRLVQAVEQPEVSLAVAVRITRADFRAVTVLATVENKVLVRMRNIQPRKLAGSLRLLRLFNALVTDSETIFRIGPVPCHAQRGRIPAVENAG